MPRSSLGEIRPGLARYDGVSLLTRDPCFPGLPTRSGGGIGGVAPPSQWRYRAGFSPASSFRRRLVERKHYRPVPVRASPRAVPRATRRGAPEHSGTRGAPLNPGAWAPTWAPLPDGRWPLAITCEAGSGTRDAGASGYGEAHPVGDRWGTGEDCPETGPVTRPDVGPEVRPEVGPETRPAADLGPHDGNAQSPGRPAVLWRTTRCVASSMRWAALPVSSGVSSMRVASSAMVRSGWWTVVRGGLDHWARGTSS